MLGRIRFFFQNLSFTHRLFVAFIWLLRVIFTPIVLVIGIISVIHYYLEEFVHRFQRVRGYFDTRYSIRKLNVVATGGTGGHLFPALNFAMQSSSAQRMGLISDSKAISIILKRYKVRNKTINNIIYCGEGKIRWLFLPIIPLKQSFKSLLLFILSMIKSFFQFFIYGFFLRKIVGFGGYASFPTLFWGVVFRKQVFIHEQNAVFGKVNFLFLIFAKKIFTFIPIETPLRNVYNVGMPLSNAIELGGRFVKRQKTEILNILIISGTNAGAESVKSILPAVINFSKKHKDIHVMHQASGSVAVELEERYKKHGISYDIKPFFENIHEILPQVSLAISRSGASSIADLLAFGVPTIFVPLKTSADNHQVKNANWVVNNNLGFLHKPWESNSYSLTALMNLCVSESFSGQMSRLAQLAIKRNANAAMFSEIFRNHEEDYYA